MSHISFIYLFAIATGCKVISACQLDILSPTPLFTQNFGSKKIIFKPQASSIQLDIGESITAYCSSGLIYKKANDRYGYNSNIDQVLSSNTAEFNCNSDNEIGIKGILSPSGTQMSILCRSKTNYDIYESQRMLPKCENYMTYAIGAPIQMVGSDIKIGVCYDLDHFKLKFVSFVAQSNNAAIIFDESKHPNELSIDLSQKVRSLKTYFPFMSQDTFNATRDRLRKSQTLFDAFEFDYTSLLQDEPLKSQLESHAYIFNTMWWRQLRQHNWRHFLDALRERTQSVKYLVHMGTYGNMTPPSGRGNCDWIKKEIFAIHKDNIAVTAPTYIWAYLKSTTSTEEEKDEDIVVIAHNSPYATNPTHDEFCEIDLCNEIEWLKNSTFGNLRRLPTLGYMFCCRPDDVALTIDYFPIQEVKNGITKSEEVEQEQTNTNTSKTIELSSSHPN